MNSSSPATATTESPNKGKWFLNLIGLLLFLGLAWWTYSKLTRFETEGGYVRIPKLLSFPYELFGKWAVVGFWAALALYNLVMGAIRFVRYR